MHYNVAMTKIELKCSVTPGAHLPEYKSDGASGADIHAFLDSPVVIPSGKSALIPTGIFLEIPDGFEVQIRPRSGLAAKNGVTVLNSPGTIDSDYRGEIGVGLVNLGGSPYTVRPGDRIAQLVIQPISLCTPVEVEELDETDRGVSGFGSSGQK